jgi:hypothetical protein
MTPPESHRSPRGRGHGLAVELERADHRLANSKTHTKMLISNEAERLVYEPGFAGHKSELMMSPASRPA